MCDHFQTLMTVLPIRVKMVEPALTQSTITRALAQMGLWGRTAVSNFPHKLSPRMVRGSAFDYIVPRSLRQWRYSFSREVVLAGGGPKISCKGAGISLLPILLKGKPS